MHVLVLGGYGLIGSAIMAALRRAGHDVTGLGRNIADARRRMPWATWRAADIAALSAADWRPLLDGVDAVVNASGALQDGSRDRVADLQDRAIRALIDVCQASGVERFVQISAPNAHSGAQTDFMRSKAAADAHLRDSTLVWTILKPGLVIAPSAYGGTTLLRALAAFPVLTPLSHADALIQTVHVDDVAQTAIAALDGHLPARRDYDLVEPQAHTLSDVVARFRRWLGYPPAPALHVPAGAAAVSFRLGDALGWLGWRTPLRTNAMREIEAGVVGDPAPLRVATGASLRTLDETLADLPSTVQERWFARVFLLKPIAIAILSLFWLASGAVALAGVEAASAVALRHGFPAAIAPASVVGGAVLDMALGLAILWRRWTRAAALCMAATALVYLMIGSVMAPGLWLDPLGPLVKVVPSIGLALMVAALQDER